MIKYFLGLCFLAISSISFAEQQTWYFVRHFEKQLGDNPSLTKTGKARAEALAVFFSDKPLNHVYSTDYNRTIETATPVAALKNVDIKSYDPRNLVEFATQIKTLNHVLVVGHSNTTPELLGLMGGAIITIKESEYGELYIMKHNGLELSASSLHIPLK
ncbi:MAG: phosphohistidine phosphatase SixA [Paraglaciecola sp.]|jgi:broad specificity phosphatase PhoE